MEDLSGRLHPALVNFGDPAAEMTAPGSPPVPLGPAAEPQAPGNIVAADDDAGPAIGWTDVVHNGPWSS